MSIFIKAAARTPFGTYGGSLSSLTATQLGVVAAQKVLPPGTTSVDACAVGTVVPSSPDAAYLARHVLLKALENSPDAISTPCLTLNRLCGSGLETVRWASHEIQCQPHVHSVLAGGSESMSRAPLCVDGSKVRHGGIRLGAGLHMYDLLWDALTDAHAGLPMGQTAENLASDLGITREQADEYALQSQQRWAAADAAGIFDKELAPVTVQNKKKEMIVVDKDEHPRPQSTPEALAKLPSVFNGVVTAANASGICDGAGMVVVCDEEGLLQDETTPLARVVASAVTGCDPTRMGIGPVSAIRQVLKQTNLTLDDMDRIEINEAFAPQVIACATELGIDWRGDDVLNRHGGAIALGHPLAASGSRLLAHLAHTWEPTAKYHLASACIGGGQGIAVLLEKV